MQRNRLGIDTPGRFYDTFHKDKILSGVAPIVSSKKQPQSTKNTYNAYTFGKTKRSVLMPAHQKLSPRRSPGKNVQDDIRMIKQASLDRLEIIQPGPGHYNNTNYNSAF